ncbi:MAG TPA: ribonuclease R, partial [Planctomycetaceae bacterium]|nr:ribonuclease R [Planctomycetaceae bacterium]
MTSAFFRIPQKLGNKVTESESSELAQKILDYVYHPHYRPAKPKSIHLGLKLAPEDYRTVRRTIKRLVQSGQLAFAANHLVLTPQMVKGDPNLTRGTFRQAAAGFGFVRPVPTGQLGPVEDIFIPASVTNSAMEGALVQVRMRAGRRGGLEGEIVEVHERARRQFSGTFSMDGARPVVRLDGVGVSTLVSVGDVRGLPVEPDDKVVVELVRFPDGLSSGEGVIMEVLGSIKYPAIDTLAVMRQYGLQEQFPDAVIEDARAQADCFVEGDIPEGRRDLTRVTTLTIDPFDARDFDDAISLYRNEKGNWELLVHIADVSHFVPVGSPLDQAAK